MSKYDDYEDFNKFAQSQCKHSWGANGGLVAKCNKCNILWDDYVASKSAESQGCECGNDTYYKVAETGVEAPTHYPGCPKHKG